MRRYFPSYTRWGDASFFIDEADQALGRRACGSGDSGVSSRVYSMMANEAWVLLRALCNKRGVILPSESNLIGNMPELLTPGAAEAIAVKAKRLMITSEMTAEEALGGARISF